GASPAPVKEPGEELEVAASEGGFIGRVGVAAGAIVYARFDDQDMTIAGPLTVASEAPANLAIGGDDADSALSLWGTDSTMHARVVTGGAFAGAAFDFGEGSTSTFFVGSVAAEGQGKFAAAW